MSTLKLSDSDFIISDVEITNITPNFYTEASNMKGNAKSRGLHQLEIDFKVSLVDQHDIKRFNAFMMKARGRLNPFHLSLQDPTDGRHNNNPLYTDAKPMLTNEVVIGQNTINVAGFSGVIPAGSYFQFPNDTKVYMILDDARPNRSVEIFPASRIKHALNERLNFAPEPLVRLEDDEFTVKYQNATQVSLKVREVM
ncbi:hypothetical protein [Vibrio vulnificus]|uniref:hypothetical protein n=1 Tax=Vibrio vulnificus TaxID=672 RepID=UPI003241FA25